MNQPGAPKGISAVKTHQRKRARGDENVIWKRVQTMDADLLKAKGISRELVGVIGRWLLFKHLSPFEAEAARRYAYIMSRFDKYHTEGRRSARSQSYERAFGADQELERRHIEGTTDTYEKSARRARKQYDKLQKLLLHYRDITGRNLMKDALDQMCCEDIEPPSEYRSDMAAALNHIGHKFGVEVKSRRGRPRKGRN